MTSQHAIREVADTASWVAVYRAMETRRADALFHDPLAELLAGEAGKRISKSMQQFQRYAYWSVTIRTSIIDAYIREYLDKGCKTVVNLGAGLDTRPYRLGLPHDVKWIEIDSPEIVALKNERLKEHRPDCQLERIGLDLTDPVARKQCLAEINDRSGPALLLTEGVVPYLDEADVCSLARDLWEQPNFAFWICEYYSPAMYPQYQSPKFKKRLGNAPFRFFPADWFALFEQCGWSRKELRYLYDEAREHGRDFPLPWWAKLLRTLIGEEKMMNQIKTLQAYTVLEKC